MGVEERCKCVCVCSYVHVCMCYIYVWYMCRCAMSEAFFILSVAPTCGHGLNQCMRYGSIKTWMCAQYNVIHVAREPVHVLIGVGYLWIRWVVPIHTCG